VLLGGDIGESQNICDYLARLHDAIPAPIYFVLGNHDYYHGSIAQVRRQVVEFCQAYPRLTFLTTSDVVALSPHVALVGHDGWADGRLGDYPRSLVMMQDYRLIAELAGLDKRQRWDVLQALGDEAAAHIRRVLPRAFAEDRDVVLLTHVPPWREACWYEGRLSDDQWAPHFSCRAMGEAILECAAAHADRRLTVLCGHTHGQGDSQPAPNVQVFTGGAQYGAPEIQRIMEFD
jgi:predicted phosphohydrolase